jgi:alpha-N-arabinofuranosidase
MGKMNWWEIPPIIKIAGGENAERYEWTETLMKSIRPHILNGLSIHCYVKPGEESNGTQFSEKSWYETAVNTFKKEDLFRKNISIMDYYDPEKKVMLAVDEWGIWVDNEPGTSPGFLFQQNTMRSALCAALMLHIFHKYSERIRLANLAQTVNVLQAIILTEGAKMIKTPTYYVFDLFKGHQDGVFIPIIWAEPQKNIEWGLKQIDVSVSAHGKNRFTVTLVNLSTREDADVSLDFAGQKVLSAYGRFIDGEVTDHNTFDNPDKVTAKELRGIILNDSEVKLQLSSCAIAALDVEIAR